MTKRKLLAIIVSNYVEENIVNTLFSLLGGELYESERVRSVKT